MSRSARLLALMESLRRRRTPATAAELAAELGVSVRTVYRDVATLSAEGAPIDGAAGLGYVLKPGFFLPPLMLDDEERDAVVLGLRFVVQRGDDALARAAEGALAKILAVLPEASERAARGTPLMAGPGPTVGPIALATIRRAMRDELRLKIRYRDAHGDASERVVWPIAVGFFSEVEVLIAWCELRGGIRHFRLDRIAVVETTADRMPKPRRVLLADWRHAQGLSNLA